MLAQCSERPLTKKGNRYLNILVKSKIRRLVNWKRRKLSEELLTECFSRFQVHLLFSLSSPILHRVQTQPGNVHLVIHSDPKCIKSIKV